MPHTRSQVLGLLGPACLITQFQVAMEAALVGELMQAPLVALTPGMMTLLVPLAPLVPLVLRVLLVLQSRLQAM